VLARIVAETGLFFIQPYWMPAAVLTVLLGFDAIGPTAYLSLALISTMLVGDTRTALVCNLVNGLRISERTGGPRPGQAAWPIAAIIVITFFVAGGATLWVQHTNGILNTDPFTRDLLPRMPFDQLKAFAA